VRTTENEERADGVKEEKARHGGGREGERDASIYYD
jgi:hypothetical protein